MKIGILTYHRSPNFGSLLQTICMFRIVSAAFPDATVEVIDLRATRREKFQRKAYLRRVMRRPWHACSDFLPICRYMIGKSVPMSPRVDELAEGDAARRIEQLGYDMIIVGSDTVWEINDRPEKLAAPNIFFLKDVRVPTKVAFSVSADQTQNTDLKSHPRRDAIRRAIEDFDFISVRDRFTEHCLGELDVETKQPIRMTADPTLLTPWATPEPAISHRENLLGHVIIHSGNRRSVIDLARSLGLEHVNVYDQVQKSWRKSKSEAISKPSLLVQDFQRPACFVVDRFHAAVFALLMGNGPVIFLERGDRYSNGISKGRDLFRNLGMEKWVIRDDSRGEMRTSIPALLSDWDPLERSKHLSGFIEASRSTAVNFLAEVADFHNAHYHR